MFFVANVVNTWPNMADSMNFVAHLEFYHLKLTWAPKVSKFQKSFTGVSRKFQWCSNKDFRVLQSILLGFIRKFQGCFE